MRVPCASMARHAFGRTKPWERLRGWRQRSRWLANQTEETSSTSRLPLSKGLESRLRQLSWLPLTEATLKLLRPVLEGRDVLAVMPRGRSRLLGYLLPLLDKMKTERWSPDETVLVLLPKRKDAEKAYTTSNVLRKWSLRTILAGDGGDISKRSQLALLRRGAQLVVCTAQRLKELLQEGVIFQSIAAKPPADGVPAPHRVRLRCVVLEDVEELLAEVGDELRGLLASLGRLQHVILAKDSRGAQLTQEELQPFLQDPVLIDTGPGPATLHAEHLCCELPTNAMRRARLLAFLLDERLKDRWILATKRTPDVWAIAIC
ncbi:unnamed protein product [Cladocopium goreaui]|uniref:ATP-dependent RNA helicase n=1 Tax=Cladocopium goreaui TaxID=2562237 RepID=A0A9P1DSF8_9DINO|nr:unnamed protein product [Cladocopium goreaui]